jgi:hypothetical protein
MVPPYPAEIAYFVLFFQRAGYRFAPPDEEGRPWRAAVLELRPGI